MEYFCGTDIIEVERIKDAILNTPHFKEKIFTSSEIDYAESKNDVTKYESFAGRFAAKEAIYKSISKRYPHIALSDIEILNDKNNFNRPYVLIHNDSIKEFLECGKVKIDVTISHIKDYAIASAITLFE